MVKHRNIESRRLNHDHTRLLGSWGTGVTMSKQNHSPHTLVEALVVSLLLAAPELPPPVKPELELVVLVSPSLAHPEEAAAPPRSRPFSASASHSAFVSLDAWLAARGLWGSKALRMLAGRMSPITSDIPRMDARTRMRGIIERIFCV